MFGANEQTVTTNEAQDGKEGGRRTRFLSVQVRVGIAWLLKRSIGATSIGATWLVLL